MIIHRRFTRIVLKESLSFRRVRDQKEMIVFSADVIAMPDIKLK